MMLTFEDAKKLNPGDVLIDNVGRRWKVSGRVKLWKKPDQNGNARIRIPLKHGLYSYDALETEDFSFDPTYNNERVCTIISHIEGR